MLLYVGVIAVLTPFLLPIFWNDLTRSNWRIFGAIGVVLASLLVGASIIVTHLAQQDDLLGRPRRPRLRRALQRFIDDAD